MTTPMRDQAWTLVSFRGPQPASENPPVRYGPGCRSGRRSGLSQRRRIERIPGTDFREPGEVAISGPDFADAASDANGGHASVVNDRPRNFPASCNCSERPPVTGAFAEEPHTGAFRPVFDLKEGIGKRCWGLVNPGMGDDANKLVNAWPGDGPGFASFGEPSYRFAGLSVPRGIRPNALDEDVGVCGDHPVTSPCPSPLCPSPSCPS